MPASWVSAGIGAVGLISSLSSGSSPASGSSPPNVNTSGTQSTALPSWYTAYLQGALGTGENLASQPYQQYGGQRLAGFNDTQQTAFNAVNNAQGDWSPLLQSSVNAASAVPGTAASSAGLANQYSATGANDTGYAGALSNTYGAGAVNAASQPVQSWTNPGVQQQWMSPYTSSVVNAIAQQGNQNWNTNLMPSIESQFISSGNPNSASNAAALGVGASQEQANISALQAQALESGYSTALTGQQTAAGQQLQQQGLAANAGLGAAGAATSAGDLALSGQQLGANTALGSGQLGTTAGLGASSALGANAGQLQSLGYNDISQLQSVGSAQQGLEQTGYNTAYQNFENQVNWPMQQLSWLNSVATGAQLPTSTSATGSAPLAGATYGPSPLAYGYAATQMGQNNPYSVSGTMSSLFGSSPQSTSVSGLSNVYDASSPGSAAYNDTTVALNKKGGHIKLKRGSLYEASAEKIRHSRRPPRGAVSPLAMIHAGR